MGERLIVGIEDQDWVLMKMIGPAVGVFVVDTYIIILGCVNVLQVLRKIFGGQSVEMWLLLAVCRRSSVPLMLLLFLLGR